MIPSQLSTNAGVVVAKCGKMKAWAKTKGSVSA